MNTKIVLTTILSLIFVTGMFAQPERMSKESRERIEAQRIAFITQQLDLSPEEATRFWPIYNTYKDEQIKLRRHAERPDLESLSDKEAASMIDKQIQEERAMLDVKAKMLSDLAGVVSPKKVLMLQHVENMFNKELLKRLQEKHKP